MMILITPTGARVRQFELCAQFMKNQTYAGNVTWIIVDDCEPRTTEIVQPGFRANWDIIKVYPTPTWQPGQNTQGRNFSAALKALFAEFRLSDIESVFIIEDDDYYSPGYLDVMRNKLSGGYWLAGEINTIYYNVVNRGWVVNRNDVWSSLFQTMIAPKALPTFESLLNEKFIDYAMFQLLHGKANLFHENNLAIGIKGQPGRAGIGAGHGWIANRMTLDSDGSKLRELIGNDSKYYGI